MKAKVMVNRLQIVSKIMQIQFTIEGLCERTEYIDVFIFSAHHSILIVLFSMFSFSGGRGVSDFNVLKYY